MQRGRGRKGCRENTVNGMEIVPSRRNCGTSCCHVFCGSACAGRFEKTESQRTAMNVVQVIHGMLNKRHGSTNSVPPD